MATKLSALFLSSGFGSFSGKISDTSQFHHSSRFLFNASCKMRPRSLSSRRKRKHLKKASYEPSSMLADFSPNDEEDSVTEIVVERVPNLNQESLSRAVVDKSSAMQHITEKEISGVIAPGEIEPSIGKVDTEGLNRGVQLQDLFGMIKTAEKNIHLLNQARVHALKDLEKILAEKEEMQREINGLGIRLAETDAQMKAVSQDKVHVKMLENQFEMSQKQLNFSGGIEQSDLGMHGVQNNAPMDSLNELHLLRSENVILKNDIQTIKEELSNVKNADQHMVLLEKEPLVLDSSQLCSLEVEREDLRKRVKDLQVLLDKANKQGDQAILVLQQNQELQEMVEKFEQSLEEANIFKLSSEKFQESNKLMQQKIDLLEDRLQKSDEELQSYIKLYQESVEEFQNTLDTIKEVSKKTTIDEHVNDMPSEFWSRLLLLIDGWLLEGKIPDDDAKLLKEMTWKKDARIYDAYMACMEKNEIEAVDIFLNLTSSPKRSGLYIIHIAAEMAPVAKVGGLGDVITGLSKALQRRGHLVEIVLPKYDCMQYTRIKDLRLLDVVLESYFDGKLFKNKIWVGTVEGLPVYFIEPHHPDKFFWRNQYYGEHDDFKRFSYFSRAALELLLRAGKRPDIIHCHDWQTSFIAPLYWDYYYHKGLNSARICFTCHNFEYQGIAPATDLASCGLDVDQLNKQDRLQDNSAHDRINPLKGAVVFSNIVTTVSPTYAQEVRKAEGGHGLHSTLNLHSKKLFGILNGIDTDVWNPTTDSFIKVQYNANDLEGKEENKDAIRKHLGLSSNVRKPLVGCITRLVPQKGIHLIRHAIYRTLELGGQFVLLGSSPIPHIQREFEGIANHFHNHDQIRLVLSYDEPLSHWIYAGSDMLIIPSIFEPCGLTQMIAMRYGSIPIVRQTGGLNDSVFDVDDETIPTELRNGYTFLNPDEQGLNNALERAFNHYFNNPDSWQQLVQKVMGIDFSWETSAAQYEELYSKSVARARAVAAGRS